MLGINSIFGILKISAFLKDKFLLLVCAKHRFRPPNAVLTLTRMTGRRHALYPRRPSLSGSESPQRRAAASALTAEGPFSPSRRFCDETSSPDGLREQCLAPPSPQPRNSAADRATALPINSGEGEGLCASCSPTGLAQNGVNAAPACGGAFVVAPPSTPPEGQPSVPARQATRKAGGERSDWTRASCFMRQYAENENPFLKLPALNLRVEPLRLSASTVAAQRS